MPQSNYQRTSPPDEPQMLNSDPRRLPYASHPEFRLFQLNKHLQQRPEDADNTWWDTFITEFFEEDAELLLQVCFEDVPKDYRLGRTLLPRFFRSLFDGGVSDVQFSMAHTAETCVNGTLRLECDDALMVATHTKPSLSKVFTEGKLVLEFGYDDLVRIRLWHFSVRCHREMVPRNFVSMNQRNQSVLEQLSENVTRQGFTEFTIEYLNLCVILQPMQELMSQNKVYNIPPRECLKTTLFQRWQQWTMPPSPAQSNVVVKPTKRSKRKRSANQPSTPVSTTSQPGTPTVCSAPNSSITAETGNAQKKKSPDTPQRNSPGSMSGGLASVSGSMGNLVSVPLTSSAMVYISQDVMVVGDPSLMGGAFEEDERLITRLENVQFDPSFVDDDEMGLRSAKLMSSPALSWHEGKALTQDEAVD